MEQLKRCEHELYCYSEKNITDDKIEVCFKCSLCDAEYKGGIKRWQ